MTFKKILFPTDFSKNANHALMHAVQIANFSQGELIVQHVVGDYFEKHPHWATLFDIHEAQKYMDMYVEEQMAKVLPKDFQGVTFRKVTSQGKPAEQIAALAEKEVVDLVVMGSARGVNTGKVLQLTNRPVLAVSARPGSHEESLVKVQRLLVAVDFSDHSKRVVQYAFELKKLFNASIYMLYVVDTPGSIQWGIRQGHLKDATEKMREWARTELVNLTPDEYINDASVVRIVETGSPSDRIAEVAEEIGADLTVLGTHEHGTIHKHLIGTTTDRVLSRTTVPVLALKL